MIFQVRMTPALKIALRSARDEGTLSLLVLPVRVGASDVDATDRVCVEHLDGSPLSASEVDLCRLLCGGAAEKVS